MNIQFLGSCANQTAEDEAVCFVIEVGGYRILVEAGPGVTRQVYRSGRKCVDFDAVIVTHSHGDHVCGFPYFVWSIFYDKLGGATVKDEVLVVGLPSVLKGLRATLEFCYDVSRFPFRLRYEELAVNPSTLLMLGSIGVRSVAVDHTTANVGLRFDVSGRSLAYSSDTNYCEPFVELSTGCNLMVHEGFVDTSMTDLAARTKHATARDAGRAARLAAAQKLALVHWFPPFKGRERVLLDDARLEFSGSIFIPSEFQDLAV